MSYEIKIEHDLVADLVSWLPDPSDVADFYSQVSAAAARDAADFDRYLERAGRRRAA